MAEDFWRRHVGRELSNIKFVSGGPRLFGVPHYEQALKQYASSVGLNDMNFGLNLVEIDYRGKQAIFERVLASADGSVGDRVSMPYDFLHVTPPQGPYKFIADSELADSNGWVSVCLRLLPVVVLVVRGSWFVARGSWLVADCAV